MSTEYEYVQRLLRLKRYEQPQDGYYEQFLDEFRDRREKEATGADVRHVGPSFLDRFSEWFHELGSRRWIYATGTAYAAIMIGVFFNAALDPAETEMIAEREVKAPSVIPVDLSGDESVSTVVDSSKHGSTTTPRE